MACLAVAQKRRRKAGTFRFRDPLNKERRFIPLRLDDAFIKGSLAHFLYINWLSANCERVYAKVIARVMVRDYKLDSLEKIEDAVVEEVEAEAQEAKADAAFRVAEAAERQARAALKRAEADLVEAKAEALAKESSANAEAKRIKAIADAIAKLADAASKLKRAGGSVVVIESEIAALLREGKKEFPEDKLIADAQDHLRMREAEKEGNSY